MCLAVPSKIVSIDHEFCTATVDTMGVSREANLALVENNVEVGDWVLVHIGIAMSKIDAEEALRTLELHEELLLSSDIQENDPDGKSTSDDG